MNNFTKEELKSLLIGIGWIHEASPGCEAALEMKIRTMIDNYCEHKTNVFPLYTASGDLPCAGFCYECNSIVYLE